MDHQAGHTAGTGGPSDGPANVLLRAPEEGPEPAPCPAGDADRLLVVSLDGDASDRLTSRRTRQGLPAEVAVLVADETRSAAAGAAPGPTTTRGGSRISWATVDGPADLADIGERIDRCLSSWRDEPGDVELCIDSVTALVSAADLPTVYRFLHVLMRRVEAATAEAHFHIDPGALDRRVTSTIETLFETVREYDAGSASWSSA